MPIYEYQCNNCEHKMEAIHKISDAPLKLCPECDQETLRKLVSAAAFKLTGTGWYETDFKDKKPTKKESQAEENKGKEGRSTADNKDGDKSAKSETKEPKPKAKASDTSDTSKSSEKSETKTSSTKKETTPK